MPHPDRQVNNPSDYNMVNTGSYGMFICSPTNPFDASLLTGQDEGKQGVAIQFMSFDGSLIGVSLIETTGVIGDLSGLNGPFPPGTGIGVTVSKLELTSGYAFIYLKQ